MSAPAGVVVPIYKGDYNPNTTYTVYNVVLYGVNSYVLKVATATGILPTNTDYWQIIAKGISSVSPEALGIGYGISSDSGSARTATLANYSLTPNGIVAVTFAADVQAGATLNINSQGAKAIYYRGSALVANVIRGGDTVTFAYDGTRYNVLCIDGGAGHEIENSAGTKLSQRDVLQFNNGLEATDNSTSQKTEVGLKTDYISLADWNAMSSAEQETYKQEHYRFGIELPDTEGVINAEYMTLLWENPNTTQAFEGQTITLNSADYDFLLWIFADTTGGNVGSTIIRKGSNGVLSLATTRQDTNKLTVRDRIVTRNSDTSFSVGTCYGATAGTTTAQSDTTNVPIAVYGIKSSFQFKVNAIADTLSTRADHCFLDDETTTVEEALTYKDVYSTTEHIVGKWIDGSTLYEKTFNFGALTDNTAKTISSGLSNVSIKRIEGYAKSVSNTIALPFSATSMFANAYYRPENTIVINCIGTFSAYTECYITLRYTKTS